MTPSEATQLATRILGSFTGPTLRDWEEELEPLDAGRAGTAYARLRREHDHSRLSIAQFLAAYRALNTTDASTRPAPCTACDDTGWVQVDDLVLNAGTDREYTNTQVEPCRCSEGHQRARSAVWTDRPRTDSRHAA